MPFEQIPPLEPIRTYIINLARRPERRKDIINEFSNRSEFKISIVDAIEDPFGALGLWKTLCLIIGKVSVEKPEYILICEDDHKFTRNYSEKKFRKNIHKAKFFGSDILLGGVSWCGDSIVMDQTLFWTKSFSGLQFTVIFSKFFETILNAKLDGYNAADYHICDLSQKIFLVHPFISIQRSYPYSDVTPVNNELGRVKQLFLNSAGKLKQHRKVAQYFGNPKRQALDVEAIDVSELMIPAYIINLRKRPDRRQHITAQFDSKNEFEITFCDAVQHEKGQIGLWESIKKAIRIAEKKGEDVILISEDDHLFTEKYDKDFLIKNVIKAHSLGADVLLGGISNYQNTVRAAENLFWVDEFYCTQFMIVYKRFFKDILHADYDEHMSVDGKISSISSNKMVIYPFASIQKDFGYSDITVRNSSEIRPATSFYETMARFDLLINRQKSLEEIHSN
ncbi:glycosyltransferase family 25 protein [Pedobacter panaciterrae]|uniref:glycosyltransferase family 25 protein n=1 Tax=Pedobacter panaciterrae TaxID=363849 RepID=UPI00259299AC|nr:glycosyltransferase family 25 protein [uncultured Pedobacter sp.]